MSMLSIFDYFISPSLKESEDTLCRARSVVLYILLFVSLCVSTFLIMWVSPVRSSEALLIVVSITLPLSLIFILSLLAMKFSGSLNLSARIIVFLSGGACLFGISITGGTVVSPIEILLFLPMVIAVCSLSFREGLIWVSVLVLGYVLLLRAQVMGAEFVQFMEPRHLRNNYVFVWFVTIGYVFSMLGLYEYLRYYLAKKHRDEKEKAEILSRIDSLTGMPNRIAFEGHLRSVIKERSQFKGRFLLVLVDICELQETNVKYGYVAGDQVLIYVSRVLHERLSGSPFVARINGDEFGLVFGEAVSLQDVFTVESNIVKLFEEPISLIVEKQEFPIKLNINVGCSVYPDETESPDELMNLAYERVNG